MTLPKQGRVATNDNNVFPSSTVEHRVGQAALDRGSGSGGDDAIDDADRPVAVVGDPIVVGHHDRSGAP